MLYIRPYSFILQSTGNVSCEAFDYAWKNHWVLDMYGCSANGQPLEIQTNSTRQESEEGGGGGGIGKKGLLAIKIAVPIVGSLVFSLFLGSDVAYIPRMNMA